MKYISYIWTVLVNLIILLVISNVLDKASLGFEHIVVASLIIIYLSINNFFTVYSRSTLMTNLSYYNQFKDLKKQMNLSIDKNYDESVEDAAKKLKDSNIKFYINSGFSFLFYVIAIISLLGEL